MPKLKINFTQEQYERLQKTSEHYNVSMSELVREGLDNYCIDSDTELYKYSQDPIIEEKEAATKKLTANTNISIQLRYVLDVGSNPTPPINGG